MKIVSNKRALDKIYKRRDRYEIPDWQRDEVWDLEKKQQLIDSILRGWKLPKFYFLKVAEDPEDFEVVDGQQRLTAIFEFFDNALELSSESAQRFKANKYEDLSSALSDAFDDFEVEYDEITEAEEAEIKEFFLRLQAGLPLTSSEKLNAVHSNLQAFCRKLAKHKFFTNTIPFADKRYAYFDIISKVVAIEIDGLNTGLRFDDLKSTFESQARFSASSAMAKRLHATFDFLHKTFPQETSALRSRSIVQSVATLAAKLVSTGRTAGHERRFNKFVKEFLSELSRQVELGLEATDPDYLLFQRSVSANVKGGARTRQEILLRKLLRTDPRFAEVFDATIVAESRISQDIARLGQSIASLVSMANSAYASKKGEDLFKATNKTAAALSHLSKVMSGYPDYKEYISDLYFLFRESFGTRLDSNIPDSFSDVNDLRTDLQHDVDHGKRSKVAAKRKKAGAVFAKYSGETTPTTLAPERFAVFQGNLLSALETDLRKVIAKI